MTRHNQIFARIKIKGLVGMLTDAADDLAARAALKRMGRNHYGSDARLLAKASGFRRDAQARLQHTPVAHPQAQAAE